MRFTPLSAQELEERRVLPGGDYDFLVKDAADQRSQAGTEMIVLTLDINKGNLSRTITDYIHSKRMEKLRSCCKCCGLLEKYARGILTADDFPGKRGRLKLRVDRPKNGYGKRNSVEMYL